MVDQRKVGILPRHPGKRMSICKCRQSGDGQRRRARFSRKLGFGADKSCVCDVRRLQPGLR